MKWFAFSVALALSSVALGSFDLVLIPDNLGNPVGPTISKIHRYEGETGAYFGSFGSSLNAYGSIAADSSTGRAYVVSSNVVQCWDYSTGTFIRDYSVGITPTSLKLLGNDLWFTQSNLIRKLNVVSGVISTLNTVPGASFSDLAIASNGAYAAIDDTTSSITSFSPAGVLNSSSALTNYGGVGRASVISGSTNDVYVTYADSATPSTTRIFKVRLNSNGSQSILSSGAFFISTFLTSGTDIESAHDGNWLYGKNNGGVRSMYRRTANDQLTSFFNTTQVTSTNGHFAVVLAPEPGTYLLFGAGLGALCLRRRRKG